MELHFDQELTQLKDKLLLMSSLTEQNVALAIRALVERNNAAAVKIERDDDLLDKLEIEIDSLGIRLLALRQPKASDLRLITTAMKISTDLERMGDRAVTIARRAALWEEVKDRLDESALSLSGGQQQRLCIARTVAVRPEVILFDEPCSALDPISTAKIEELIDELTDDYTIVIVTHNMQQAARVSELTAFMYLGELVEFDETNKIFTSPSDRRTQDYITGRFG